MSTNVGSNFIYASATPYNQTLQYIFRLGNKAEDTIFKGMQKVCMLTHIETGNHHTLFTKCTDSNMKCMKM